MGCRNKKKRRIIQPNHVLPITTLAYSPDGTVLASGSQDGTVLLWKMRSSPVTRLNITPLTVEASPIGKHLTFNVNISDAQNVTGFQFGLQYDSESLRFIPNTENATDNNIKPSPPVIGDNMITFTGNASQGYIITDGIIATIAFEILKHADVTLTITDARLMFDNGERSRPVVGHAWLVEPERIPEDVNRDWQLNAADLEFVSSRIGQTEIGNSADINKDGQIDIADLVLVRNALYGSQLGTETD